MRNECHIVRDLLPLYIENMASEETREFVEAHLSKCPECNEIYLSMTEKGEEEIADEEVQKKILPLQIVKKKLLRKKVVISVITVVLSLAILISAGTHVYNFIDRQNKIVHVDYGVSLWYSLEDRKAASDFVVNCLHSMGFGYDLISVKFVSDAECLLAYCDREGVGPDLGVIDEKYHKYLVFYVELKTPAWANPFWGLKPSTYYDNLKWVVSKDDITGAWQGTYVTPDPSPYE